MNCNIFEKANQIVRASDAVYLGVIDEDGCPSVSTVSTINPQDIFTAYFATGTNANKTRRLLRDKRACICYRLGGNNVTLAGEAEIITDQETKNKCWLDWFINHFPLGKTDPDYCIIKFTAKRVSLWIDNEGAEFTIEQLLKVQSRCGLLCSGCSYRESHGCKGCVETNGHPFYGECSIAVCCQNRGFSHCGQCGEIPCEKLRKYSCDDPEHGDKPPGARIAVCRAWAVN